MCGDPYGWMCDECFGKMRDTPHLTFKLCDTCLEAGKLYWEEEETDGDHL
jgi:hypothetical protein